MLNKAIRIINFTFFRRYYDLISKVNVRLKSLLRQGLTVLKFYVDLVFKLKKSVGSNDFSKQFIKIISHYKKIGHNIDVLQQTSRLVVNQSWLATLLSSLFAHWLVGRQTLLRFQLKYLSLDERVRAWCCVCGWTQRGLLLDFFYSGMQLYILLSPYLCFISFLYLDLCVLGDYTLTN